jgi:hypothetical protein
VPQQFVDPRGDTSFSNEEVNAMAGDIAPGELGWLKLDEDGTPSGTVIRRPSHPGGDEVVAPVVGTPTRKYDEITTPSGAPITRFMNPDTALWDAGMLARNPVDKETQTRADEIRTSGVVVNKPGML